MYPKSALWRMCIVVCGPVFAIACAVAVMTAEPDRRMPTASFVASASYQVGLPEMVYFDQWKDYLEIPARNEWFDSGWPKAKNGYRLSSTPDGAFWLNTSDELLPEPTDRAMANVVDLHNTISNSLLMRKVRDAAMWLGLGIVPFAIFWLVVWSARWVRAGSKS
ncbi:MAG: hypothetical protein ACKVP7_04680 [Hyphomicrobiaceae bacterium]